MIKKDVIIIGGGAAGFFAGINIAAENQKLDVLILERGKDVLTKVKISGGGRCNVTHAEFIPKELTQNYPRGQKELLGPFFKFMPSDTIEWFKTRGVELKVESDGRMFPRTDSSQTIIDCFQNEATKQGVDVFTNQSVKTIYKEQDRYIIATQEERFSANKILICTGSNPKIWKVLEKLGHTISNPVPSLFTFNISDKRIDNIPGVVAQDVAVRVLKTSLYSEGPLLITHWGMSAPAILKLSAFGALELALCQYKFQIEVNFIKMAPEECLNQLRHLKLQLAKKNLSNFAPFNLPKRLWQNLVLASGIKMENRWADLNKSQLYNLSMQLTSAVFNVKGKSTYKEEFVTAGGVSLKEIDFKNFESKLHKNLYFAGEVLNIDAITGGFNFQNAWTSAYIAAQDISK